MFFCKFNHPIWYDLLKNIITNFKEEWQMHERIQHIKLSTRLAYVINSKLKTLNNG